MFRGFRGHAFLVVDRFLIMNISLISSPHPRGHRDLVMAVAREISAGLEVRRVFGDIG